MVLRQLTKEQAKEEVKKLVDKYNRILESGSIKRYKEGDTKAEFIEPLFEALGWDVRNTENDDEVVREEKISKGRVDYSFRINGIPKFFLEAKALKEDLDNIKFVEQAVNYSWHKGCTWAVLTDFEAIKIFNAEWKSANPLQAQFGQTLPCQLFLEKFDTLWLLSRDSFEKKLLDIEAEKWQKKIKKTPVDKQLLSDLTKFRELLTKNILKNNASKNLSGDDLDEAVQRIIDRLIFIRTLEDKELEAPMLQSVIREDLNKKIYKKLNLVFRKIDEIYNSKLFEWHLCDQDLVIDDDSLSKVINGLFITSDNTMRYDFSAIDADVLGNIYEQYLGHILKKTDKRAKLAEGKAHRKEQGIYYTPTYVVDYIVKNTVGELAKDKKFDLKNIKILDPACGSGSFLMKAFDYLVTLDKKKNGEIDQTKLDLTGVSATYGRKVEILKNNIFGVDLDPKAVEIAQLNLLLKAAEKKHRLPTLKENIKVGNSLIDDSAIAGNRAFKWEEQFKDIMQNGGFDVVIGNPPYVKARDTKDPISRKYMETCGQYETLYKMWDLYIAFVEKGIKLLKPNGCFAMIIPDTIGEADYTTKLAEMIIKEYSLYQIDFFPSIEVFSGVGVRNKIIFVKNSKKITKCKRILHDSRIDLITDLGVMDNNNLDVFRLAHSKINFNFENTFPLDRICYVSYGARFNSDKSDKNKFKKEDLLSENQDKMHPKVYTEGKYIDRYFIKKEIFVEWDTERCPKRLVRPTFPQLYPPNKILMSRQKRIATYSDKGHVCDNTIIVGVPYYELHGVENKGIQKYIKNIKINRIKAEELSKEYNLKYILAIINSKLMRYFLNITSRGKIDSYPDDWKKILIKEATNKEQKKLIEMVDKILVLNKQLKNIKDKQTDEKARLEKEIQKLDTEIDEEVYKLYGINAEEKKSIEDSLK